MQSFHFCKSSHKICCTIVFGIPIHSVMSLHEDRWSSFKIPAMWAVFSHILSTLVFLFSAHHKSTLAGAAWSMKFAPFAPRPHWARCAKNKSRCSGKDLYWHLKVRTASDKVGLQIDSCLGERICNRWHKNTPIRGGSFSTNDEADGWVVLASRGRKALQDSAAPCSAIVTNRW